MAQKPKPKTEEKAKGLIGLKKGEKVKGAAYSVGNYKGKTLNLSKKELGKAGRAAAAARTVDISKTKYEGKKVLGPGGKPLTGTVDLGGGNIAVYKNGVRVRAQKPKPKPTPVGRSGGSTNTRPPRTTMTDAQRRKKREEEYPTKTAPPSTSMNRPGQRPPGAAAYTAARNGKPAKPKGDYVWVPAVGKWVPRGGYTAQTNPYNRRPPRGGGVGRETYRSR